MAGKPGRKPTGKRQYTMKILPDLHRRAKLYAVESDLSFSDVVSDALVRYLDQAVKPTQHLLTEERTEYSA